MYCRLAALLAVPAPPPVLADAAAAALLALAARQAVLAHAAATARVAGVAHPPMCADGSATALLASGAPPTVLAEVGAAAVPALVAPPPVLAGLVLPHHRPVARWSFEPLSGWRREPARFSPKSFFLGVFVLGAPISFIRFQGWGPTSAFSGFSWATRISSIKF